MHVTTVHITPLLLTSGVEDAIAIHQYHLQQHVHSYVHKGGRGTCNGEAYYHRSTLHSCSKEQENETGYNHIVYTDSRRG